MRKEAQPRYKQIELYFTVYLSVRIALSFLECRFSLEIKARPTVPRTGNFALIGAFTKIRCML